MTALCVGPLIDLSFGPGSQGYKAPAKIDPRLLDPKYIFQVGMAASLQPACGRGWVGGRAGRVPGKWRAGWGWQMTGCPCLLVGRIEGVVPEATGMG